MTKQDILYIWRQLRSYDIYPTKDEMRDLLECGLDDFHIVLDGSEFRFIHTDAIWDIYVNGIKEVTEECYFNGTITDQMWWLEIDWEKTAKNCLDADGYGHHFASYDGDEMELDVDKDNAYYFFRVN